MPCVVAPVLAEGQPLTDAMPPLMAAARIFALENHLHGDIGVANENEAHIGERFEVNHAVTLDDKLDPCAFTMRRRGGPIVEVIAFHRLSGEAQLSRQGSYVRVQPGSKDAVCEIENEQAKSCSSSLDMLLMAEGHPSELTLAHRALRHLSSVCPTVRLPF
jgi:hypothetical protein